jgi:ERCC4-related helicase
VQVLKGGMGREERAAAVAGFRQGLQRVLLMDSSGAVGLDLSFVQHVFLMEPLGDVALEQQIISRAHRLGAVHAVHAEVLVMKARSPPRRPASRTAMHALCAHPDGARPAALHAGQHVFFYHVAWSAG